MFTVIEVNIPGVAWRHLREIADPAREPELFAGRVIGRRNYGSGYSVRLELTLNQAAAMAYRLAGLAEAERTVRSGGDGADSTIERACDVAAARLAAAVAERGYALPNLYY